MYENIRKIQDVDVKNKTVIVRVNFDVPMKNGEILDNTRITASITTIEHLLKQNAKVVLISHAGRPEGQPVDDLSLMPMRFELGKLLNKPIKFAHIQACDNSIKFMDEGEVLLLENLRFDPREESEDEDAKKEFLHSLIELGHIYVNDAFGVYRDHASVYDLAKYLPSYAGFSVQEEIESLNKISSTPEQPYVAVIGGVKIDTKIDLLKAIVTKVDTLILGGAMAYTFLKAKGVTVGKSKVEDDKIEVAQDVLTLAQKHNCEIVLPIDHIAGKEFAETTEPIEVTTQHIPDDLIGLDIGQRTLAQFRDYIEPAKTILWNGPMGVFEWDAFSKGTEAVGEYIALSTAKEAYKVAGGADTTYAMQLLRIKPKRFNHVSVGGGMMLQFLSGSKFSVLDVLCEEQKFSE